MTPHTMVAIEFNLMKYIFNEVLIYQHCTGLSSCHLSRIEAHLKEKNVEYTLKNLSLAISDLVAQDYVKLELFRIREDEDILISLELTGKTARPLI